ncbi:YccF domain-containing protein [Streptococcus didelphis]|uniref:YccF domain-containing protein n=1 Tax=Streptococcus didelphis TaxID=102886 RepID=A0ABY9LHV6_9STRE|nr:YccF domain-containing protein [Streptococcus didelphis]WMB28434.1 YccF domain-containing protein [Streptococcus didelphis]WMB29112.1 YccF domain-containing protein [Streptococcus didelphis]
MTTLANIIWFIFAGFWAWLFWSLAGIILSLSILGLPLGLQCFKIANFGLFPFRKTIIMGESGLSLLLNILWILLFGWELALAHLFSAFLLCLTIIGIPFAKQSLKLAKLSLFPFGAIIKSY